MAGKNTHEVKERRSKMLIELSHRKHEEFLRLNTGKTANVLFEKTRVNNIITGYSGNYIRVEHSWQPGLAGQIREVKLKDLTGDNRMSIEII
jgi:threonylcarbamoyladenosine tRNA methylthiotransferase MtaB